MSKKLVLMASILCTLTSQAKIDNGPQTNDVHADQTTSNQSFFKSLAIDSDRAFAAKDTAVVVVIGGGPAGYTAGMQTTRAGLPTVIFTGPNPGGQLMGTTSVENYPGVKTSMGSTIPETMAEQARDFGATIIQDTVSAVDFSVWPFVVTTQDERQVRALSVIIATGATPRMLQVPGESNYWGRGVSSCALCDCMFFQDKAVFIAGGGDAAVEEAMQLSPFAQSSTMLVRGNKMRAVSQMQGKLNDYPNVKTLYNKRVTEVIGDGKAVTALKIKDTELGKEEVVKADGLFLAIGQSPNTDLFKGQIELTSSGYIVLEGRTQATSVPGVFAAGDVEDADYRQAIVSAGHGCQAGLEAVRWLREVGITDQMIKRNKEQLFVHDSGVN